MTFREKFAKEGDRRVGKNYTAENVHDCDWCPSDLGYEPHKPRCPKTEYGDIDCETCWNRQIPGTEEEPQNNINKKENKTMAKTKNELMEEIKDLQEQVKRLERFKQYEDAANELKIAHDIFMGAGFTNEQAFEIMMLGARGGKK